MEKEYLFISQGQRFDILKAISKGFTTASTIAEHLHMSITYAAQQLKLMEAYGIISASKAKSKKVGKPALQYVITKQSTALCHISSDNVFFHSMKATKSDQFLVNAAHLEQYHTNYFLFKVFFQHEDIFSAAEYVGIFELNKHKLHLFIITNNVDIIRKKYSTITVSNHDGNSIDIALWSHTYDEVAQGLERQETYFIDKVEQSTTLLDKTGTLKKLKNIIHPEDK